MGANDYILQLKGVTKTFPGVRALHKVDMEIKRGQIHGLLGENGAGKSTLIKILTGAFLPDSGEIVFDGNKYDNLTPRQAMDIGISCIYQELNVIPHLTVAENIFLGKEIYKNRKIKWLDLEEMGQRTKKLLAELNLDIKPSTISGRLGAGHQQMIEICRALSTNARLIIMDEPTASLTTHETDELFRIMNQLRERGVSILFVSHRLEEAEKMCDRYTVLRDGEKIIDQNIADSSIDAIIQQMVGRDIHGQFPKEIVPRGEVILSVKKLNRTGVIRDINFDLHAGEILGIAGLVGAGRTEMIRAMVGADPKDSGSVEVGGKKVYIRSPRDAINAGIAFLTENRKEQGLILGQTIEFNITLVALKKFVSRGILSLKSAKESAKKLAKDLQLRPPNVNRYAGELSGGNQQKVVIAKWLATKARIFIFDEPTKGIDVGAKVEVYNLMNELVKNGAGVIMISSELPEVLSMSDRVLVMHEGVLTAEMPASEATEENIMAAAVGFAERGAAG